MSGIAGGVLRNTAALAAARVVERLASVAVVFLVARQLGVEALGVYSTALVFLALLGIAGEGGAANLITRELARRRELTATYLVHLGLAGVVVSAAITACCWVVAPRLGFSDELARGVQIAGLALIPTTLRSLLEAGFVAHQKVHFQTLVTCAASLATIGLSAVVLERGGDVLDLLEVVVLVQAGAVVLYVLLAHRFLGSLRTRFSLRVTWHLVGRVRAFAGLSALSVVFVQPEVVILSLVASEREVGLYAAALRVVSLWQIVPQTVMTNVFPVLARAHRERADRFREVPARAISILLALSVPAALALVVLADPIVRFAFGPGFDGAADALRLLALSIPLFSTNSVYWRALLARGRQGEVFQAMAAATVVRVATAAALVAWFAVPGAAASAPLGYLVYNLALQRLAMRERLRVSAWALGRRFLVGSFGMAAFAWLAAEHLPLGAAIAIAVLTYPALLLAFGSLDAQERAFLSGLVRARRPAAGSQQAPWPVARDAAVPAGAGGWGGGDQVPGWARSPLPAGRAVSADSNPR